MHSRQTTCRFIIAVLSVWAYCADGAQGQEELAKKSSWQVSSPDRIRDLVRRWAAAASIDLDQRQDLRALVDDEDRLAQFPVRACEEFLCRIFPQTCSWIETIQQPTADLDHLADLWTQLELDQSVPDSARDHLRLIKGRWLVQHQYYDESLEEFADLTADQVVDPATLLFYRGVAQHRLLKKGECLETLDLLLENEAKIPRRYTIVSKLMAADIKPVEEDSLDEIARMMEDIRRRQSLFRSGTRVLDLEKEVLDKLDDLIEKIEQQMQNQQQMASSQQNSAIPMGDSQNVGGKGKGNVQSRGLGDGGSWGDLPPKQRAAALSEMAKDLPPHYREVIEEYFRQLAKRPGK